VKEIKGFEGLYSVTTCGKIWSHSSNKFINQSCSTKSKYLYVKLYKNNKGYHRSVHRLVAEAYIDNINNLPEVDHKDDNIYHNYIGNLQWITHKDNMIKCFKTKSPVRNYRNCALYYKGIIIKIFNSISECCRYCKLIGLSYSTMQKYRKYGDYTIKCND
jgi:hypothetical protein